MKGLSVNAVTKLWALLCTLIAVSLEKNIFINGALTLIIFLFLMLQKKWKTLLQYGAFYVLLAALLYAIHFHSLHMVIFSEFYVLMFWHLFPIFLLAWDFINTPPGEISALLSRLNMPTAVILGVLVVFRFFPTMRAELKSVFLSMKNRGLTGVKQFLIKPAKSCEYVLIPLLLRLLMTADQLSISAIARGGESPGHRNSYYERKLGLTDGILMGLWTVLLILSLWIGGRIK